MSRLARCAKCGTEMALGSEEAKGTAYHGHCWRSINRRAWKDASPEKRERIAARMPR